MMSALRAFPSWNERGIDGTRKPRARWFFICEGSQTERKYFESLFKRLDKDGLPVYAEGIYVRRDGEDRTASDPKKLLEQADAVYEDTDGEFGFNDSTDVIVIVFDADVFKGNAVGYAAYLASMREAGYIPAVTYPSFALYLLLHQEGAYENLIAPHQEELFENGMTNETRTFVDKLFSDEYHINPKTGPGILRLARYYSVAQVEEKYLNNDPNTALVGLTSNIGVVIESFLNAGQ